MSPFVKAAHSVESDIEIGSRIQLRTTFIHVDCHEDPDQCSPRLTRASSAPHLVTPKSARQPGGDFGIEEEVKSQYGQQLWAKAEALREHIERNRLTRTGASSSDKLSEVVEASASTQCNSRDETNSSSDPSERSPAQILQCRSPTPPYYMQPSGDIEPCSSVEPITSLEQSLPMFTGEEGATSLPTTMMICNIPCRIQQNELKTTMDSLGFAGTYDFLYLPISPKAETSNRGYGFVNFRNPKHAQMCIERFNGYRFMNTHSRKVCEVRPARLQGLEVNARRCRGDACYL